MIKRNVTRLRGPIVKQPHGLWSEKDEQEIHTICVRDHRGR